MNERSENALTLACVGGQSETAAALHEALATLFPQATVSAVDTGVERTLPNTVHCAIVDATEHPDGGIQVLRHLRASGYAGAAVLVPDPALHGTADHAAAARLLGARSCVIDGPTVTPLGEAVAEALRVNDDGSDDCPSSRAARALRQTQRLIAAGELAMRLQHALNNPLAALLAEAQLLELEDLPADHRASVQRIIELLRRVIGVVRGLDGVGRA